MRLLGNLVLSPLRAFCETERQKPSDETERQTGGLPLVAIGDRPVCHLPFLEIIDQSATSTDVYGIAILRSFPQRRSNDIPFLQR
jgi:hypothetical protein